MRKPSAPLHEFSLRAERRQTEADTQVCAQDGCGRSGEHRAPGRQDDRRQRLWLCKRHAREWNLNWDYCRRMTAEEIAAARRAALVWNRPTWPVTNDPGTARAAPRVRHLRASPRGGPRAPRRNAADLRALDILGLPSVATPEDVRARFRELLRRLHPDLNDGRHVDATRLRAIIWAWRRLRPAGAARTH